MLSLRAPFDSSPSAAIPALAVPSPPSDDLPAHLYIYPYSAFDPLPVICFLSACLRAFCPRWLEVAGGAAVAAPGWPQASVGVPAASLEPRPQRRPMPALLCSLSCTSCRCRLPSARRPDLRGAGPLPTNGPHPAVRSFQGGYVGQAGRCGAARCRPWPGPSHSPIPAHKPRCRAGTESSPRWPGRYAGAIQAGEAAAKAVARRLERARAPAHVVPASAPRIRRDGLRVGCAAPKRPHQPMR